MIRLRPTSMVSPVVEIGAWLKLKATDFDLDRIRVGLTLKLPATFKSRGYKPGEKPKPEDDGFLRLFRETKDKKHLLVPRAVPIDGHVYTDRKYAHPDNFPLVDWPDSDRIQLGPNKWQPFDQRAAYEALSAPTDLTTMGRLFVLGCGRGKTVLALKAAMTRYTTTAIIVDTYDLATQWKERIADPRTGPGYDAPIYTGSKAILSGAWRDKKMAIFTAQTLMQRKPHEWPQEFRLYWGLAIFDEVHVLGAPVFSRVVPLFYGERWGLTATIDRLDGLDLVFRAHLSPEPCYSDVTQSLTPEVHIIKSELPCPDTYILGKPGTEDRYWPAERIIAAPEETRKVFAKRYGGRYHDPDSLMEGMRRKRRHSIPLTVSTVSKDLKRNKLVISVIRKLEAEGRSVLVLGNRTKQLRWLHKRYNKKGSSGMVHGGTPRDDRSDQLHKFKVVFMAQKIGTKGLDKPPLDTLVLPILDPSIVTPANTQQSVGRIQREHAGKKDPILVVAFIDPTSYILRPSFERWVKNIQRLLGRKVIVKFVKA